MTQPGREHSTEYPRFPILRVQPEWTALEDVPDGGDRPSHLTALVVALKASQKQLRADWEEARADVAAACGVAP